MQQQNNNENSKLHTLEQLNVVLSENTYSLENVNN
jgi:hypothetical protein